MKPPLRNYPNVNGAYCLRDMWASEAYRVLTRIEIDVLNIFMLKRQIRKVKGKRKGNRKPEYEILNANKISFLYSEATAYGINKNSFTRSLDHLLFLGFIDITHTSKGNHDPTLFGLSERWRLYGTSCHIPAYREETENGVGIHTRFKVHPHQ
jgi:hypothetical protein